MKDKAEQNPDRGLDNTSLSPSLHWQNIFDAIEHPAFILDPNHTVIAANDASVKLIGKPLQELIGKQCYMLLHGESAINPAEGCPMEEMLKSGRVEATEIELETLEGVFLVSCTPVFDDNGKLDKIIHIATDITGRKKAENSLKKSESRLKSILSAVPTGIGVVVNRVLVQVNSRVCEMTGRTMDELIGKSARVLYPTQEDFEFVGREKYRQIEAHGTGSVETQWMRKDGSILKVFMSSSPINPDNLAEGVTFTATDITDRKKAEQALKESEVRFRQLADNAPIAIVLISKHGDVEYINKRHFEIMGYTLEDIPTLERWWASVYPDKEDRDKVIAAWKDIEKRIYRGEKVGGIKRRLVCKNGSFIDVELNVTSASDTIIVAFDDITERGKNEQALYASEKKFRNMLETVKLAAVILDRDGNITFCNDYLLDLTGRSRDEALQNNWFDLFLPEDVRDKAKAHFRKGLALSSLPMHYENQIVIRDGAMRLIVWNSSLLYDAEGKVMGVASLGTDVTEHRKIEEQLRQAQKMESIGQLASGVAHDFNNILSAIVGYASLTLMKLPEDNPLREYQEQILKASDKATTLTQSLLAFSRKQVINPMAVNLTDIVKRLEAFLSRLIREDIAITTNYVEDDITILADSTQIEQAIINLVTNARDAMPKGGRIVIRIQTVQMNEEFIEAHGYGMPGKFTLISVSDTGEGMDAKTRESIFDPFFTTKEQGKGTGLGLSMVYGIVKQHNGYINVYSEPGMGSTFRIYLPIYRGIVEQQLSREEPVRVQRGSETILIAEDDDTLRQLISSILANSGYEVVEAANGREAVAKYRENKADIKLVILDGIMPQMNGKEAHEQIKRITPSIKSIFMSGYAEDIFSKDGLLDPDVNFMLKPVKPSDLLIKVREVLDE